MNPLLREYFTVKVSYTLISPAFLASYAKWHIQYQVFPSNEVVYIAYKEDGATQLVFHLWSHIDDVHWILVVAVV